MRVWRSRLVWPVCLLVLWAAATMAARGQQVQEPAAIGETQRLEGEAILALADAALEGRRVPEDFELQWQNDFLKAQEGTFLPFTLTFDASGMARRSVLVYVRAVRRDSVRQGPAPRRERVGGTPMRSRQPREPSADEFPLDVVFAVDLEPGSERLKRVSRGVSIAPGSYNVIVVVRERVDPAGGGAAPHAAVLTRDLDVPDLTDGLTTSSIMLADRLEILGNPVEPEELPERPYVIGRHAVTPAADRVFGKSEELIVLFLIYDPFVTSEGKFDLQVEYHFFRRGVGGAGPEPAGDGRPPAQEGERYFNHTDPQRFNPAVLGPGFDPSSGNPVMAGQGVPLSGFEAGDYRLAIRVTDLLAGKSILRVVHFTVG